jgi:alginate O-acetyltransferase complex protein AlgI
VRLLSCGFWGEAGAKSWLILTSLLFYGVAAPAFLPLLILSVAGNLLFLHVIHGSSRAGWWTAAGVALNLIVLGWFKYWDAQPALGLNFFTFTQIGCLLHAADGAAPPPRVRDYALFAAFFPALLAGPILNPREMLPQFARSQGWRLNRDNLATGSGFFLIGLLKKTLLADPLSTVVGTGFAEPASLTLFPAWQAAASYSLQLYFDFSGYTDMAIGLAWMVGLRFPDNFGQPYRATSMIAYWQRWHMSLTRFLVTNVHAPLTLAILRWRRARGFPIDSGAQTSIAGFLTMIGAPVVVTIVLVALWHRATLPFLLFGLLHAVFLLVNHAWRLGRWPTLPKGASAALTYLCVLVGAVIFRAATVDDAGSMLAGMAGLHGMEVLQPDIYVTVDILWLLGLYAIVWFAPTMRQLVFGGVFTWQGSPQFAVAVGCAATLGLLAAGGTGEFLYFRF